MQRNTYLLSVLFVLTAALAHAQDPITPAEVDPKTEEIRRKVRIGLQVSPEITWLKAQDNNISSGGTKFGFSFGPMIDFRFGENYAFGTGINIVNAQGELTYLDDSVQFNSQPDEKFFYKNTRVEYKLRYVEIPLLLRLNTNEIGYMRYFAHFGVVPAVKIGAKGSITDQGTHNGVAYNNNTAQNIDLGKDVSFPNMSLMVGVGLSYGLTPTTSLYVSASFVNGFIDATDNPKGLKSKAILNRIPFTVGIFF